MQIKGKTALRDEVFMIGDNPEDDLIEGEWYLQLKITKTVR